VEPLMFSIAVAYRRIGDFPQAERYFTSAIMRTKDRQEWESVTTNMIQLGFLHSESGAPDKALDVFKEAIAIAGTHGDAGNVNSARLGLAESQITLGEPDAALETLAQARKGFMAQQDT